MKLGILGAGMIAHDFLSFVHEIDGLQVQEICATPRSREKLEKMCEQYHIPQWTVSEDELISNPEVDTVYVALPNHLHYEAVKKSLEAGKNVICEKPFTSNARESEELIALAKEKGLFLFEAVSNRYLPNALKIRELLPELGQIKVVNMNYSQYSSRYDAFKAGNIMPAFNPEMSGGALMDINIYNLNMAVFLFGKPIDVNYFANVEKGIDTSGVLVLSYPGFQCVLTGAKDCKAPLLSTIQGDEGCILIPSAVNALTGFELQKNKDMPGHQGSASGNIQDYNEGKHRMYPEFVEFVRMVNENDHEKADAMNEITQITMDVQTEARKKAGVKFAADKA